MTDLADRAAWAVEQYETDPDRFAMFLAALTPLEREDLLAEIESWRPPHAPWVPLPHQQPPPMSEPWWGWVLLGGRGAGKTAAVTRWLNDHALGPACLPGRVPHRMGIIAPTLGDASASIVHGDDGLITINPDVKEVTQKGGTVVRWPNGAFAYLLGVNTRTDVDRCRAKGNRCADLREEIAAWRYLADGMAQADFGLRKGTARWVGATTPKPRPTIRKLASDPTIRVSTAETDDNPHLNPQTRARLYAEYGNTRVGLQELKGLILEEVSGALWSQELIDQYRVTADQVPHLTRVRTYVDPSWGTTHDECGIVVAGLGVDKHVYILGDLSKRCRPVEWGMLAAVGRLPNPDQPPEQVEPREWFGRVSDRVVYERNFQGEQVRLVMKLVAKDLGRRIITTPVSASVGKRLRADPVVWAYERGRVHHVGTHATLEWQMTNWVPPEVSDDTGDPGDPPERTDSDGGDDRPDPSKWSPDRLDAVVFAVTDLALSATGLRRPGDRRTVRTGETEVIDGGTVDSTRYVREVPDDRERPAIRPQVRRIPAIPR